MASVKIKCTKIMRIINDNAVWGHLSKNYLTRKFIERNICDAKYSQFTVSPKINFLHHKDVYEFENMCCIIATLKVHPSKVN